MVCGNTLFRPDIREHSALIEKPSAHRKSSRRISGQSESPPLRSGEVFQQTARPPPPPRKLEASHTEPASTKGLLVGVASWQIRLTITTCPCWGTQGGNIPVSIQVCSLSGRADLLDAHLR